MRDETYYADVKARDAEIERLRGIAVLMEGLRDDARAELEHVRSERDRLFSEGRSLRDIITELKDRLRYCEGHHEDHHTGHAR